MLKYPLQAKVYNRYAAKSEFHAFQILQTLMWFVIRSKDPTRVGPCYEHGGFSLVVRS